MRQTMTKPEEWVDLYGDMLYGYALKMLSSPNLAHDVVQETFLAALKAIRSFKQQSQEKTWLFGILKHKIMDHLRNKYRELPVADVAGTEGAVESLFDRVSGMLKKAPADWQVHPSELIEKEEFWATLNTCLDHLPEKTRDAFKLRELEEENTEEICKVLNITATNLWVILHRARVLIRSCLEKNWFKVGSK